MTLGADGVGGAARATVGLVLVKTFDDLFSELSEKAVTRPAGSGTVAELDAGVIVGQVEDSGDSGDQFGLLLAKDSPLTDCVSQAVDALTDDGTLADLQQQWLSEAADAPVLS